jgi:NAD(P)-dependent dehydrogenase (short-subunit alcohol dehydrogenase family)
MSWQLRGRVAVVTGASSGIGRATAVRLAEEGMTVVAVARRAERLAELADANERIVAHAADVADTAAVDGLAGFVSEQFGACHALVNNAGVGGGPLDSRDDLDDTLRTIEINLAGTVRCTAAFADLLAASAPSRVVNVASVAGKVGIGPAGYAASKFGMVGLSEALSFSWAERGVTVCQLNPGFIETEGFPQEQVKDSPMAPLLAQPEDVADAIVDVLRSGKTERTVPRVYRSFVALRHLAPPVFRRLALQLAGDRASGSRD